MSARMVVSKLTHNEANVKITNASADNNTVGLATTLKLASDTLDATQYVNIDKIMWSTAPINTSYITITRNSVVIATLFGTGELNLNSLGMTEDEGNTSDIVVTLVGTGGTVYMKLKKTSGYGD